MRHNKVLDYALYLSFGSFLLGFLLLIHGLNTTSDVATGSGAELMIGATFGMIVIHFYYEDH